MRDHFVKHRKHPKYLAKKEARKRQGRSGGINSCFRPSCEASKADLAEYHRENMGLRRAHQRSRVANSGHPRSTSIATGNRHGGAHKHAREIARTSRMSPTTP